MTLRHAELVSSHLSFGFNLAFELGISTFQIIQLSRDFSYSDSSYQKAMGSFLFGFFLESEIFFNDLGRIQPEGLGITL